MDLQIEKNNTEMKKAIVSAVAFFDMFDYPLTDFEIWKFIKAKCGLSDVQKILTSMSLRAEDEAISVSASAEIATLLSVARNDKVGVIKNKNGFYFLRGRSETIDKRLRRYTYTDRKFKRAMRVTKIFKMLPWIEMIAISNIIGANNLKDESDIDFFIITKTKKIWLTRFFCSSIAQALGLRPKKGNERDKICLNFYITDESINIKDFMLNDNDVYFNYWLVNLIPIYDANSMYKKFIKENNWIKNYFPNWRSTQTERRRYLKKGFSLFNVLDLFNGLEDVFKKLQFKLMPKKMKELANKDTKVVINDKTLKMHVNDRRLEYNKRFSNKLEEIMKK